MNVLRSGRPAGSPVLPGLRIYVVCARRNSTLVAIESLISPDDRRIELLRDGDVGEGPVLLWVQRAQRSHGNLAANLAVEIANELKRPVVACFCLAPAYPSGTLRA